MRTRNLRSLRDLRVRHLGLLRNIVDRGCKAIQDAFNVGRSELRIYLHYLPSYYHCHVHFSHVQEEPSHGFMLGRAHDIEQIMSSLEIRDDYYAAATLSCVVGEGNELYAKLAAGSIS